MNKKSFSYLIAILFFCFAVNILFVNIELRSNVSAISLETTSTCVISNSNDDDGYVITSDDFQASLSAESVNDAISILLSTLQENDYEIENITINFDNLTLAENETLNFSDIQTNLLFTGNITADENTTSPIFNFSTNQDIVFEFNSLTLSARSSEVLISLSEDSSLTTIIIENCNFSSNSSNSYAIFFNSAENSLYFGGNNVVETTYFSNYFDGLTLEINSTLENEEPLIFTFPYNITNNSIFACNQGNASKISFVSKSDNYSAYTYVSNSVFMLYANVNITYISNGGEFYNYKFNNSYSPKSSFYYNNESVTLPSSDLIRKTDAEYGGWFGVIEIDEITKETLGLSTSTFYFGLEEIESFEDVDISSLTTLEILQKLKTSIYDTITPISSYDPYSSTFSDYFSMEIFMLLEATPTFSIKWNYTLSFETFGGDTIQSLTLTEGEPLDLVTPTKQGYTFIGWYTDADLQNEFTYQEMPSENLTLYAAWETNKTKLILYTGLDSSDQSEIYEYEDYVGLEIDFTQSILNPTKEGYNFVGWFTDQALTEEFSLTTMPDTDLNLYAKWEIKQFTVTFMFLNQENETYVCYVEWQNAIDSSDIPTATKLGAYFLNWHTSTDFTSSNIFDFETLITENLILYAEWFDYTYEINFVTNTSVTLATISAHYGESITLPTNLTRENYTFTGWYTDSTLQTKFTQTTMPLGGATLYAGWQEKIALNLELSVQSYSVDDNNISYKPNSNLSGFTVYYLVDGVWTTSQPTSAGTYDVLVTRAEDSTYSSFSQVIEGGLVIEPIALNLYWIVLLCFVLFLIEMGVSMFLIHLRKVKGSVVYSLPLIFGGTYMLPNTQLVLIILSATLALFGFIFMIYELVMLHRTNLIIYSEPSKLDNRERFKDDLKFQESDENNDLDFIVPTKTEESFGNKYSAQDIESLLNNDNFTEQIKSKRRYSKITDNSSTNWNTESTENGSDVLSNAKEIKNIINDNLNDEVVMSFVDDSEQIPPHELDDDFSNSTFATGTPFNVDENFKSKNQHLYDDFEEDLIDDYDESQDLLRHNSDLNTNLSSSDVYDDSNDDYDDDYIDEYFKNKQNQPEDE